MSELQGLKEVLEESLNPSVWSFDSLHGLFIIGVIVLFVYLCVKRGIRFIGGLVAFIFLVEVGHVVAYQTNVGELAPITKTIFKYDVLTALAQLCVGTKLSETLLYVQAWLNSVMQSVVDFVESIWVWLGNCLRGAANG